MGPPTLSYFSAKFGCYRYCANAVIRFFICHVIMWISGCGPPTVSYHSAKFGDHRCCGSADISFFHLLRDTLSTGHVTLELGSPHHKLPLCQVWWPVVLWNCRYKVLYLSWSRDQKVTLLIIRSVKIFYLLNRNFIHLIKISLFVGLKYCIRGIKIIYLLNKNKFVEFCNIQSTIQVSEKKLFHTSSFIYFAFIFSERITIISSEVASKVCELNVFHEIKRKGVLHVIYLLNYDSSKSTLFMLNMTFDVFLFAQLVCVLICTFL